MKVVLCDRQKMFIEALASVLTSRGFEVCRLAFSPEDARAVITAEAPDVALVGAGLTDGGRFLSSLAAEAPATRIVLLLDNAEDAATVGSRTDAGPSGVTARTEEIDRIVTVLDRVGRGESVVVPRSDAAASAARSADESDLIEQALTEREREVLDRLASGQGTAALAAQMGISVNTARTHIQNAMNKLGAHSRLEVVAVAVRAGRVDSDSP
jgi:two-component system, NarL family, nitrate/nitrite response regulator NarL